MCYGCWEEAGKPAIANGRTIAAVPLVGAVYDESCDGGELHIVLDDMNVDDANVRSCAERAQTDAEKRCAAAFSAMDEDERMSALAFFEGWISLPQRPIAE